MPDVRWIATSQSFREFTRAWATASVAITGGFLGFGTLSPEHRPLLITSASLAGVSFICAMACMLISARLDMVGREQASSHETNMFCLSIVSGLSCLFFSIGFALILLFVRPESKDQTGAETKTVSAAPADCQQTLGPESPSTRRRERIRSRVSAVGLVLLPVITLSMVCQGVIALVTGAKRKVFPPPRENRKI